MLIKVKHIFGAQIKFSVKPEKKNSCILNLKEWKEPFLKKARKNKTQL